MIQWTGFFSIELVDLVDISSLLLVETAVISWWGQFVGVTHKEVGVRDELKILAGLKLVDLALTPFAPKVAIRFKSFLFNF